MSNFKLSRPPLIFKNDPYALNWANQLIEKGSDHSELRNIEVLDSSSDDATKNKHVSNNDIKTINDIQAAHSSNSSAHGVTGNNVGTEDYATETTGGTVLKGVAVADAVSSIVSIDSADASDLATAITLSNELKTDINALVTDLNNAITQLNGLLASQRTAKQIET